ncbi:biotin transporter BioY [Demequina subtropica]|uniref:biotin transporter BioY n=1 Tax=Demequina subtropica TaxID=1638989 RepID=UPI00078344BD|nr:biotin transporter BioY [Demequina subtropica]
MSQHRGLTGQSIALVAVFAAFIAAASMVPGIELLGGVPLTLQTFAVVLAALVLGPWRGLAAVAVYLLMGLFLPVFAGRASGLEVLVGPSGGYLIGFLLAAVVVGGLAQLGARMGRLRGSVRATFWLVGSGLVSIPVIYAVGAPWLAYRLGLPMLPGPDCSGLLDIDCASGVTLGVVPFIPGDILKVVVAGIVAAAIHRAYPGLLGAARRVTAASSAAPSDQEDEAARATA